MKIYIQRSQDRGIRNHGWLHARFSFSFADYYNPQRMGFGKIRVLNDDTIAPGEGFDTHPHSNMEIITIPTKGSLLHQDNTGSKEVITPNEIQVMSAGSGILHSEHNASHEEETRLFQIWIETAQLDVSPRHETKTIDLIPNTLNKVVCGDKHENTLFIYQDASLYLGSFTEDQEIVFTTQKDRGTFIMVVEGALTVDNEKLDARDSVEIEETQSISMHVREGTKLLVIDTPL